MSSTRNQILGGLWGSVVGDALGVPVEFKSRAAVQADPVCGMRGLGTHHQPPGTWSDDSSLALCTVESLLEHEFDPGDMGDRFVRWSRGEIWTPHGEVFDIGLATRDALGRIASGMRAEEAGGRAEFDNGNGSLMRILPVALRFARLSRGDLLERTERASAITHGHARSRMACGLFALLIPPLLAGASPADALAQAGREFSEAYRAHDEFSQFRSLLDGSLGVRPEGVVASSGYVMHTLTAALWCLLTTENYRDCVLRAVNLGGDTDTTGCVAGGLAGVAYGVALIPEPWTQVLARRSELAEIFDRFTCLCETASEMKNG